MRGGKYSKSLGGVQAGFALPRMDGTALRRSSASMRHEHDAPTLRSCKFAADSIGR